MKENDDLLSATRYAIMMLRYAECPKDQVTLNWERLVTGAYVRGRDG